MRNERTTLTKEQFERYTCNYPCNHIIVRIDPKEITTPTGIKLDFNDDVLYAEGTDSHVANMSTVMGTIIKQPEKLYFNPHDANSMSWECEDIETEISDTVWSHPLNVRNADEVMVDGVVYQSWCAEDIFCAKRGDKVIPLNGHLIMEPVYKPKLSELDPLPPELDKERAIVRFCGTPNKRYRAKDVVDIIDVKPGDTAIIDKNTYIIWLERFAPNANFDNGKMYYCIQRKHILAVL